MADRSHELSALLSSAALVLVGGLVGAAAKLGERIVIGRLLSPDAYGEVSLGLAVLTVTMTLALVGCSQGVARFVPRYDDHVDRRGVWLSGLGVTGVFGIAFGLGLVVAAEPLANAFFETDEAVTFVRILGLTVPITVSFTVTLAAIRGMENTVYYTALYDLVEPVLRIGLIAALLLAGMGIVAAGVAYLIAAVVVLILAHLALSRLMALRGEFRLHTDELLRFSAPLVVSSVVSVLLTRTDTLMLGYFRSSFEVGLYDAAYPIAGGLLVVLAAFGFLYLPIASRLDAAGDREALDAIYATTTKWVYVLTFPAFVLFVAFPEDVIRLFFGPEYVEAATVLPILAVGFFFSAAAGRDRETLSAVGATTWIAIGNLAGLALNVVLNLVLIPRFGVVGASVTSVASLLVVHVVICGVLARSYDITPFSPPATRTYLSLPIVLLPLAVVLAPWITVTAFTLVPTLLAVAIGSLAILALVGGFEPDDVAVIDALEETTGVSIPYLRRIIPEEPGGLSAQ